VPLKPGWITEMRMSINAVPKLFTGNLVPPGEHINGACVLPWNVCDYSSKRFVLPASALGPRRRCGDRPTLTHSANHFMQHVWQVSGKPPTFPTWATCRVHRQP